MSKIKTKAIFYAYSNNALDHLAPYIFLCNQKKMHCEVIYGEDFVKFKVRPKENITKILADCKISTYDISKNEKNSFLQFIFSFLCQISRIIEKKSFIPNLFKNKMNGLINRVYSSIDVAELGKNTADKVLKDTDRAFVFTDNWNVNKEMQGSFLTQIKGKAKIITTGHAVWHWHHTSNQNPNYCEDIAIVTNQWEFEDKKYVKHKEITGSLRFSKQWLKILDQYNDKQKQDNLHTKKVLVLTHTEKHTNDWNRMFKMLSELAKRKDISLRILPHIRGMINMKPPEDLKNAWDKNSTLDIAVKSSDIVIFWESSGIFEAVLRNKKILFLSFLSVRDGDYIWQKSAPKNIIINNEKELSDALNTYDKDKLVNNSCFENIIWPKGDPWTNVSNFVDDLLK